MKLSPLRVISIICGLLLASILTSPAQVVREWTTTDGAKHQGSIMFMSSKSITIKGARGMTTLSLAKLSAEDQQYIAQLKSKTKTVKNPGIPVTGLPPGMRKPGKSNPVPPLPPKPNVPPKSPGSVPAKWPSEVRTAFSPSDIVTVSETRREGYIYRSPHFEFRSPIRLPHSAVRDFSLIFESTYDLASAMPIGLNPKPGGNGFYVTQLYESYEDYQEAGGLPGSAGSFSPGTGQINVPLPSLGVDRTQNNIRVSRGAADNTLIHEVTHQVMMRWNPLLPTWMVEGFAEVTSTLPYEAGRFRLSRMSKAVRESTGEGPSAGRSFEMVPLETLMRMSGRSWNTAVAGNNSLQNYRSASVLTYYFLRLDGEGRGKRLISYIKARLGNATPGSAEQKYLLDGRSYDQLQKDVARAWREEGLRITYQK